MELPLDRGSQPNPSQGLIRGQPEDSMGHLPSPRVRAQLEGQSHHTCLFQLSADSCCARS